MAEYELVHEIQNLCRNKSDADVFFEEITQTTRSATSGAC